LHSRITWAAHQSRRCDIGPRSLDVCCVVGETFSELRSVVSPHHDEAAQWMRYSHFKCLLYSLPLGRAKPRPFVSLRRRSQVVRLPSRIGVEVKRRRRPKAGSFCSSSVRPTPTLRSLSAFLRWSTQPRSRMLAVCPAPPSSAQQEYLRGHRNRPGGYASQIRLANGTT
jgi:hypothetical protein